MTNIKALEELRELCASVKSMDFACVGCDAVLEIADRINGEVSERFMELPVDADGVPIHVGDRVAQSDGEQKEVQGVGRGSYYVERIDPWDFEQRWPSCCHHVKPRTIEDVLGDAVGELFNADISTGSTEWDEVIAKYADEIRGMMA